MMKKPNLFKRVTSALLAVALVAQPFAGLTVAAAHDDQELYSLATDSAVQDLAVGTRGDAAVATPYLNRAGGATLEIVENPLGGNSILVNERGATYHSLDINRAALGLVEGQRYTIRVDARIPNAPEGTQFIIGGPDNPWGWLANSAPNANGFVSLTLTADSALLSHPQVGRGFRLQTNNTADFIVDEIVVTWLGVDNAWTPPTDEVPPLDGENIHYVTFADDWATYEEYASAGAQMTGTRVTNFGRTDDYSFRLENVTGNFTSGDGNYFRLDLPEALRMGGTYAISWWVYVPRAENPNAGTIMGPGIVFNSTFGSPAHQPTNTQPGNDTQLVTPFNNWHNVTVIVDLDHITGDVDHLIFRFRVNNNTQQPAVYFIDDIQINNLGFDDEFGAPEWDLTLPSLANIWSDYFYFGNILEPGLIQNNPDGVIDMFLHHYNALTAENAMKPDSISGGALQPTRPVDENGNLPSHLLDNARTMVDFAEEHELYMVGHTLVWHEQSARWLYRNAETGNFLNRAEAMENMRWFIEQYAGYFEGRIHAWDVTNEVFTNSGGANNPNAGTAVNPLAPHMADSPVYPAGTWQRALRNYASWYQAFANGADFAAGERGSDYIYYSFVFARRYAPSALLIYNDFNEEFPLKTAAMANMTEALNARWAADSVNNPAYGNPNHPDYGRLLIEAIGMQAHYNQNTNWNNVRAAIQRFSETGARIHVTELDIQFTNAAAPFELSEAQLAQQADWFAQLFRWYVEFADYIDRVSIWGREDGSSWRGQNGATHFDRNFQPKPAFWAIVDPFAHIGEEWPGRERGLYFSLEDYLATGSTTANVTLANAGSTLVAQPDNSKLITNRDAQWNGLDVMVEAQGGDRIVIEGHVPAQFPEDMAIWVQFTHNWNTTQIEINEDGTFSGVIDVDAALAANSYRFRIASNGADGSDIVVNTLDILRFGVNGEADSNEPEVYVVSAIPTAVVNRLNGNQNELVITVTETLSDGTVNVISESFMIRNNASGTFEVEGYQVFVNTQGNTQIREIRIVD